MGVSSAFATLLFLLPQQPAAPVRADVKAVDTGLVVVQRGVALAQGCLLGDGGVRAAEKSVVEAGARRGARAVDATFRSDVGTCTTPGGVVVHCRREGVKLTFPSGRELLYAPDGHMHLRDGTEAGPFHQGVELRLSDGTTVAIDRSGSRRSPIECVEVTAAGEAVCLYRRGNPTHEKARVAFRVPPVFCLGDGGSLYRVIALGPLVTFARVLAPMDQVRLMPEHRLCVLEGALVDSMSMLAASRARQRHPESVAEIELILAEEGRVFRSDMPMPPRTGSSPLQYLLHSGYDLTLVEELGMVRMQLARHERQPFLEWRLGYMTHICGMSATTEDGSGQERADTPMPDLQANLLYHEIDAAMAVVAAVQKNGEQRPSRR